MSGAAVLDHLVLATPDLDRTVAEFAGLTGLRPVPGGSHPGRGTRNCLLGLGDGAYLEIIGPDREAPAPAGPRWFGIDTLSGPCLVTWAARCTDIAARVARARAAGLDPGTPVAMSRRTPDGGRLAWRLTPPGAACGLTPFLLDWGDTPHPTAAGLPVLPLLSLHATAPDPGAAADRLAALGVRWPGAPFAAGPASLTAVVAGHRGAVRLGRGVAAV
ncbi:VOC family protein [Streptomyces pinistramenti]|uniref:VOC family protein n=1 Tax=Streptomyces pinistramenti TaxID=2884812 RepID=UPI001D069361|nr:VOC family protein [Streptomyces pinistramenti]MCB5907299.1 VOC family protein [Streptomyces pinistramenti]